MRPHVQSGRNDFLSNSWVFAGQHRNWERWRVDMCLWEALLDPIFFFLMFWPCRMACGMLVPQPGIELLPSAVEAQSLNQWSTKEVASLGHNWMPLKTATIIALNSGHSDLITFYFQTHKKKIPLCLYQHLHSGIWKNWSRRFHLQSRKRDPDAENKCMPMGKGTWNGLGRWDWGRDTTHTVYKTSSYWEPAV